MDVQEVWEHSRRHMGVDVSWADPSLDRPVDLAQLGFGRLNDHVVGQALRVTPEVTVGVDEA